MQLNRHGRGAAQAFRAHTGGNLFADERLRESDVLWFFDHPTRRFRFRAAAGGTTAILLRRLLPEDGWFVRIALPLPIYPSLRDVPGEILTRGGFVLVADALDHPGYEPFAEAIWARLQPELPESLRAAVLAYELAVLWEGTA